MILKRCDKGHYYDGEIYAQCPECSGAGPGFGVQTPQTSYADYADYADEDSVTVALPRKRAGSPQAGMGMPGQGKPDRSAQAGGGMQGVGMRNSRGTDADGEDGTVTMALPRSPVKKAPNKQGFKPAVGWLVCILGKDFGSSFTLKLGKNYIGRSVQMDVVLQGDESIAMENHAAVYYVPKQRRFAIEPGTGGKRVYVNRDQIVRPVWIKQHDIITVGNAGLMFFPCCGEHFSWEELIRRRRERQQGQ